MEDQVNIEKTDAEESVCTVGTGDDAATTSKAAPVEKLVEPAQEIPGAEAVAEPPQAPEPEPQQTYTLPPGYGFDPTTGQVYYVGPAMQQPTQPVQPAFAQPAAGYAQPQQPSPEQIAAAQAESMQRYGQVVNSVEQFLEGEATVSDVVKTLYTNTAQDDQLWKGVLVGAAAAVLLTSEPVRKAMGQTLGSVFPGLKQKQQPEAAPDTSTESPNPDKE